MQTYLICILDLKDKDKAVYELSEVQTLEYSLAHTTCRLFV